mgnify:CR=1 FL=1
MLKVVGQSIERKDYADKVRGIAKYTVDYVSEGYLHARMLTSPYAHANIKSIDTSGVWEVAGVQAVLTGDCYPGYVGVLLEDRPIIAKDKVRYHGEPVAVVVANNEYQAKKAVEMIKVEYEPLPVVNSPTEAIKSDAPLVHENIEQYRRLKEVYPELNTNIASRVKIRKGDIGKGWAESEVSIESNFSLPQSDHVALEQRNARAEIKPDGKVIIYTSSQSPFMVRKMLSRYFGIDDGMIVVNTPVVGGAFGGKAAIQLEFIAYLASKAVDGRPVKLVNTREEDMISSPVRIGLDAKVKLGSTKDGIIKAAEITYLVDGGAYSDMAVGITKSIAADCTGPYKIDNVWCDSLCMYTNHPYATSFRGFGHASISFAIERAMDMLAKKLDIDPLELRIKNAIASGDTTPTQTGLTTSNIGDLPKCITRVGELINWVEGPIVDLGNNKIKAKGIGCFWKTSSTPTDAISAAVVIFNPDGSMNLSIGSVELGPGTKTVLAQILAEKMKVDINKVHVNMDVNTQFDPIHWKTVASMTTYMVGRAVIEAADDAIRQLKGMAAIVLRCPPADLEVGEGRVFIKDNPNIYIDITEIVHGYKYENGNGIGGQIIGRGSFIMRHLSKMDKETGKGNPGPFWTVGAQAVEVEFDTRYCTYEVLKVATVMDVGKVINPKAAEGVVTGGVNMGIGLGSREYFIYNDNGIIQNPRLRGYKVMRFGEEPDYITEFIETPQIDGPYGGRGFGEHGILGVPAALGNSLSLAAGVDLNNLPLLPEYIWKTRNEGNL